MLAITVKENEVVHIGNNIRIIVIKTKGKQTIIGIDAPKKLKINRGKNVES